AESCAARDFLSAGKVGSVEFGQIRGFNLADMDGTNYRCGIDNPHLWEMAIHQFDLLRFLFERDVERVFCTLLNPSWSWSKGNALTHAWLELEGGVKVDYVGTYVTQGPQSTWENSWRFEGTGGTLLWHDSADGPLQYVSGPGEVPEAVLAGPLPHENLQGTLNELLKAIDRGAAAYCSGRDNLKSLAICSACEISARERQVVEVAEAPNC
ncbi:MAG: Gfo/Idh/MocA family oxidoreductase, partial [Phycisphaerae bacterium]|nr:Gfo/Idh/MocA family oxidoreductase [Phycisphaerae bacterium]